MITAAIILVIAYVATVAYCVYKDRHQEDWDGRYFLVFIIATFFAWWLLGLLTFILT